LSTMFFDFTSTCLNAIFGYDGGANLRL